MEQDKPVAQNPAHPAQGHNFLRVLCAAGLVCTALAGMGCSVKPAPKASGKDGIEVDAALSTGHSWILFRFSSHRYLRLPLKPEGMVDDSLQPSRWLEISSPGGAFRPVQAVQALQGNFYLVDAAQNRLCLYDSAAQLLSTFPFPSAVGTFIPGVMEVFRGGGGVFTFFNYQTGDSKQFVERAGGEGGRTWVLRSTGRLPIGLQSCIQDPEEFGISCLLPDGPMKFDPAMNRIRPEESFSSGAHLFWDAAQHRWTMAAESPDGKTLFQFLPAEKKLMVSGFAPK